MPPNRSFGANLRRLREAKGWEREDLAKRLNESGVKDTGGWDFYATDIMRIEAGIRDLSIESLITLCDALGCSADALLGRE